jgi:hypothetical protein
VSDAASGLPSRREFTRRITALVLAAPAAGACGIRLPPTPPPSIPAPADPRPCAALSESVRPELAPPPDGTEAEAEILLRLAESRYGRHLEPEQLAAVRSGIVSGLRAAERLRRLPLRNGDEPDIVFAAYRREG